jgi:hypothetical protein
VRGKAVCDFHGGKSTGPKTESVKARQRAAVTKIREYKKQSIEDRAHSMRMLHSLEDAMYVLKMTTMPQTRGRKPVGHLSLKTFKDMVKFAVENPQHLLRASGNPYSAQPRRCSRVV